MVRAVPTTSCHTQVDECPNTCRTMFAIGIFILGMKGTLWLGKGRAHRNTHKVFNLY